MNIREARYPGVSPLPLREFGKEEPNRQQPTGVLHTVGDGASHHSVESLGRIRPSLACIAVMIIGGRQRDWGRLALQQTLQ